MRNALIAIFLLITCNVYSISLTVDGYTFISNLEIKSGETLIVNGTLEVDNVTFFNNSTVSINTGGVLIVNGDLLNKNNSDNITFDGDIDVSGTFTNGNGGAITGTGTITAEVFEGNGDTFGEATDNIPPDSTFPTHLPVELISFTANASDGECMIKWVTASEINNDYFVIEKSYNGFDWFLYKKIYPDVCNSNGNEYLCNDRDSKIVYYRLSQVDLDGESEVFNTIAVDLRHFIKEVIYINILGQEASKNKYMFSKNNIIIIK